MKITGLCFSHLCAKDVECYNCKIFLLRGDEQESYHLFPLFLPALPYSFFGLEQRTQILFKLTQQSD